MKRFFDKQVTFVAAIILVTSLLLSGCATEGVRGEAFPNSPTVKVSQGAALQLVNKLIASLKTAASGGRFTITVTQEEVTSALALGTHLNAVTQRMSTLTPEQAQKVNDLDGLLALSDNDDPLADGFQLSDLKPTINLKSPQIRFLADGNIELTGFFRLWLWYFPLNIVFAPRADNGNMELDFVSGKVGSIPVPEGVVDWLGEQLVRALGLVDDYVSLDTIKVTDGRMTLSGRVKIEIK